MVEISPREWISTTRTRTQATIPRKILSALPSRNIANVIENCIDPRSNSLILLRSGNEVLLVLLPGEPTPPMPWQSASIAGGPWLADHCSTSFASNAAMHSSQRSQRQCIAVLDAPRRPIHSSQGTRTFASGAKNSVCQSRRTHSFAPAHVRRVSGTHCERKVYDLTVKDCPEFFANGILVHNSVSLSVWGARRFTLGTWTPFVARTVEQGRSVVAKTPQGVFLRDFGGTSSWDPEDGPSPSDLYGRGG